VQAAGAVACIIVNSDDTIVERVAAKNGDPIARRVDIPVLCVPLYAGEAVFSRLPAPISIRVWQESSSKDRREVERAMAARSPGLGAPPTVAMFNPGSPRSSERAVRKQLVKSLQAQLREKEAALHAAQAAAARFEERLGSAKRAAARARQENSGLVEACKQAEEAGKVAEEARIQAENHAAMLEEDNAALILRLSYFARHTELELEGWRRSPNNPRRRNKEGAAVVANGSPADRRVHSADDWRPQPNSPPATQILNGERRRAPERNVARSSPRADSVHQTERVADALRTLHDAMASGALPAAQGEAPSPDNPAYESSGDRYQYEQPQSSPEAWIRQNDSRDGQQPGPSAAAPARGEERAASRPHQSKPRQPRRRGPAAGGDIAARANEDWADHAHRVAAMLRGSAHGRAARSAPGARGAADGATLDRGHGA